MRREPVFDDDWREPETDEIRVLRRARPFARLRLAGQFTFAAALVAGLSIAAHDQMRASSEPRVWAEPSNPVVGARAATPTVAAGPLLRLDSTEGEPAGRAEPPRWNPATGLREDALASGSFDAIEAPFLRITLMETEQGGAPPSSLFVTLARRAAEARGLSVLRTGLRGQVETKFGLVETAGATLAGEGTRACTAFQSLAGRNLRLDGWLCGILGQAPDPRSLACAIDRLALGGPATPTLDAAFTETETRRDAGCAPAPGRAADATGSIAGPSAPEAKARTRKNEAQMRRIVQARQ